MREIVFDTETTGFKFSEGDRLVEIGCVELVNRVETGRTFHAYFNPGRSMPREAEAIHGLSDAFLADKPAFHTAIDDLMAFMDDSPLVAHNASFDFGFLNGELTQAKRDPVSLTRMVDTLVIARSRHPGAKHTLDALCNRFGIDRSRRVLHGALLDAQLLAQVYVELMGGRQIGFGLDAAPAGADNMAVTGTVSSRVRAPRLFTATDAERATHAAFVATLKSPLWEQVPG